MVSRLNNFRELNNMYWIVSIEPDGDRVLIISESQPTMAEALDALGYDEDSAGDVTISGSLKYVDLCYKTNLDLI